MHLPILSLSLRAQRPVPLLYPGPAAYIHTSACLAPGYSWLCLLAFHFCSCAWYSSAARILLSWLFLIIRPLRVHKTVYPPIFLVQPINNTLAVFIFDISSFSVSTSSALCLSASTWAESGAHLLFSFSHRLKFCSVKLYYLVLARALFLWFWVCFSRETDKATWTWVW